MKSATNKILQPHIIPNLRYPNWLLTLIHHELARNVSFGKPLKPEVPREIEKDYNWGGQNALFPVLIYMQRCIKAEFSKEQIILNEAGFVLWFIQYIAGESARANGEGVVQMMGKRRGVETVSGRKAETGTDVISLKKDKGETRLC